MFDLLIQNGTIVTPEGAQVGNVYVRDGRIAAVSSEVMAAKRVIDAAGLHVLPGVIDAHVHYREPGMTEKNDFLHGSMSSAIGGCTTVVDMPNTVPPVDSAEHFRYKLDAIRGKSFVDYCLWGILIGNDYSHVAELYDAGVAAYKIFLGSTGGQFKSPEEGALFEAMKEIAKTGLMVGFHAEDRGYSEYYERVFKEAGKCEYADFERARDEVSESLAVARLCVLAAYSKVKAHILHLSTKNGLDILTNAAQNGVDITAETCPQYLFLKSEDYGRFGKNLKSQPPVRTKRDQEALLRGLRNGTVKIVSSDSAPQLTDLKAEDRPVWEVPSGIDLAENMVSIMLTLVNEGKLSLAEYVRVACENPARMYGIYPRKGAIRIGSDGDFTIVDMNKTYTVSGEDTHGKLKYSLLAGVTLQGKAVYTVVRGRTVADHGKTVTEPFGEFINPRQ